jgi:hypothetical protein
MNTFIAVTLAVSGTVAVLTDTLILAAAAIQALRPVRTTTEATAVDADGAWPRCWKKALQAAAVAPRRIGGRPSALVRHARAGRAIVVAVLTGRRNPK